MPLSHFLKRTLLSGSLLGLVGASQAQSLPPDSVYRPKLLLKAGLRLTHLRYTSDSQNWQFLVPLSVGTEYRLAPRLSLYGLLEADVLASRTAARRRRGAATNAVPAAALSLGLRYYYGQPRPAARRGASPAFGRYLALDGGADWAQLPTSTQAARRRNVPAALTPAVYALWGVQNRLRPHFLYDLNAGLGLLAPPHYYNVERASGSTHWNLGAQVNIRLYFGY